MALRAAADRREGRMEGVAPSGRSVRYPTLDILRGLALISMVTAHVSLLGHPTFSDRVIHEVPWIDGAFYFVALSGVVSGLVHRRLVEKQGFGASARKLARRAGFIYLVQIGLVVATITLASVDSTTLLENTPTWSALGGAFHALGDVLTLRIEPNFTGVLPMYVMFLLWAIPMVWLLKRGWWWAVAGSSIAVYAVGRAVGGFTFAAWSGSFDPLGWQLLFTGGLLVGWSWEHQRLAIPAEWRRRVVIASAAIASSFLLIAVAGKGRVDDILAWSVTKFNGGFIAFVFAGAVLITAYMIVEKIRQRSQLARDVLRPIEILGLKGLPGYVAMVLTVLVFNAFPGFPRNDVAVLLVIVICGFAEYGAWKFDAWRRRRGTRPAAKPTPIDAPMPLSAAVTD